MEQWVVFTKAKKGRAVLEIGHQIQEDLNPTPTPPLSPEEWVGLMANRRKPLSS